MALICFFSPLAAQAQTWSNISGSIYNTTGSGSSTTFSSYYGATPAGSTPVGPGITFNQTSPPYGLPPSTPFGLRWNGNFYAPYSGVYTFIVTADDGFIFTLTQTGNQVGSFQRWSDSAPVTNTYQVTLTSGVTYAFDLDYYENGVGGGQISLSATAPPAPTTQLTLTGTVFNGTISLNWNADPLAVYYNVYRVAQQTPQPAYSYLGQSSTTNYTDATGIPGVKYWYTVYAFDSLGRHGPQSNNVLVAFPPPVPAAPTGLSATPGNASVTLNWTPPGGSPTSYDVQRSYTSGGPYSLISSGLVAHSYLDTAISNRTKYYYVVRAENTNGVGASSNEANATPAAPDDAQFVSETPPPATIRAGQSYPVSVTMENVGTNTWGSGYQIISENPYFNSIWGSSVVPLTTGPIAPGANAVFTFTATAPTTPGSYNFQWKTSKAGVHDFGDLTNPNVVCANAADDAKFVSQSVPTSMVAGQSYPASVTMKNIGTNTWAPGAGYQIVSENPYFNSTWGTPLVLLTGGPVAPGQNATFAFSAVAPTTPGTYNFQWKTSKAGVHDFGDLTPNLYITVSPAPDFTIDLDTSAITLSLANGNVPGGGPSESMVTAVPLNGFTGTVTLSLSWLDTAGNSYSGSPGGINYWFDPAADYDPSTGLITLVDANSQISTFSICPCQGDPLPGTYTLVITGTSGTLTHSIQVPITITN